MDNTAVERSRWSRRTILELGSAALAGLSFGMPAVWSKENPQLQKAIAGLQYLTPLDKAFILDKGKTGISKMPPEKIRESGLTPETWFLEVAPDPGSNSIMDQPMTRALGNALDWDGLMQLARKNTIRFMQVITCTNGPDPFHMSLWEGVPLMDVLLLAKPKDNVRRVYYQSYHPESTAPFQSSLPMAQALETPPGEMPVILAFKMNGREIPASHGGPVRVVVPGVYGSKSIKWVQRIYLTNDHRSNDSDAELNNDPENALKTRARFIHEPKEIAAGISSPITGMAQVGISGLKKVQYCVHRNEASWPGDDPYRSKADWRDATILPPPANWGGGLPEGRLPRTNQTDPNKGLPVSWPLRYTIVHWAAMLPPLKPGSYELCCRTIDGNGIAQPLPRTLPRTGYNALHAVTVDSRQ